LTLLTPTRVRELLRDHGLAPSRRLGQNFVVDANVVRKVVRDAGVVAGEQVVEVGPGLGSLTLALREAGARVLAVEVDAGMVRALAAVLGDDPGVTVVHADALTVDWAALVATEGAPAMVANLPYNVATPVVLRALEADVFDRLLVMVQREVGERWAAGVGSPRYSGVSVKVAALAGARVVAGVPRGAFFPVPKVDSVTVLLRPRPWDAPVPRAAVFALVEAGFRQRRKRLRNALAGPGREPAAVEAALAAANLDPGARAEELGLEQWVALTGAL
jgi:16S rRNA (adenine1518-N6/adenine1519-N6)-dimethyltransferase